MTYPAGHRYYGAGQPPISHGMPAGRPIKDVRGLGLAITVLIGLCALIDLAQIAIGMSLAVQGDAPAADRGVGDDGLVWVELGWALAALAAGICWLVWQHRLASGLARWIRRSPGWHVGSWFIPVVSLWFPLENMRDLSRGLDEARPSRAPVGPWWAAWIISGALTWFSSRVEGDLQGTGVMAVVAGIADLTCAVLAILVVRDFTARAGELRSDSRDLGGFPMGAGWSQPPQHPHVAQPHAQWPHQQGPHQQGPHQQWPHQQGPHPQGPPHPNPGGSKWQGPGGPELR